MKFVWLIIAIYWLRDEGLHVKIKPKLSKMRSNTTKAIMMLFCDLKLSPPILQALEHEHYVTPTLIQEKVIPLVSEGHDVIALAQTGSGKSASFILPILEYLSTHPRMGKAKIRVLVLTPTRELTLQVAKNFELLGAYLPQKIQVASVIGGESIGDQMYALQQGCDVVVATSGRLLDIIYKKQINLSHVDFFVLDEADKMLDVGFAYELDAILALLPAKRHTLLFSATYPSKMEEIALKLSSKAICVRIDAPPTVTTVSQRAIEVNKENRGPLLRHLLKHETWKRILVFMANKRATDNIAFKFRKYGFLAESFHGDLSQEDRTYTLDAFKDGKINILFSTDIAARGLHIEGVECVINYDLPRASEDYIHRIGRTARAGKSGVAISFIGHEDSAHFALIEKRCHIKLEKEQVEGFKLIGDAPVKEKGAAPMKGKRPSKKDKLRAKANSVFPEGE